MTDTNFAETLTNLQQFDAQTPLNISPIDQRHYFFCQGVDAEKFLQGQLTCNLKEIETTQTKLGLHCSPQGRSLTSFRLSKQADEMYLFQCHQDLAQSFEQQLGKYMVFSKAEFSAASIQGLCVQGAKALEFIQSYWPLMAQQNQADQQQINEFGCCIQVDTTQTLFELWLNAEQLAHIREQAQVAQAQCLEADFYVWQQIQQGIAVLDQDSTETFVPQMLNYELIDGISFNKGCYTGQEVVARAKYRGQVKRRLQRFFIEGEDVNALSQGKDIFVEDAGHNKRVGQVVSAVQQPKGLELLGVISVSQLHNTQLYLAHKQDKKLQPLALPYATFNTDDNSQVD